jgi:hypothetical protein
MRLSLRGMWKKHSRISMVLCRGSQVRMKSFSALRSIRIKTATVKAVAHINVMGTKYWLCARNLLSTKMVIRKTTDNWEDWIFTSWKSSAGDFRFWISVIGRSGMVFNSGREEK